MNDKPISTTPSKRSGRILPIIVGCVFFAVGTGFLWFVTINPLIKSNSSGEWTETPCTVIFSEVKATRGDGGSTYKPQVEYEYSIQGQDFESKSYDFTELNRSQARCKEIVAEHPVGKQLACYVNPNDLSEAVIVRDCDFSWLGVILPLLFAGIGLAVMIGSFFKKTSKSISGGLTKPSKAVAKLRAAHFGRAHQDAALSNPDLHPGDIEDQVWDVPQKLKPKQSRLSVFLIALVIALFWNGIVLYMLYGMLKDFKDLGWLALVFGVPFLVIGLLIAAGAVRAFAGLFNPSAELALSTGAIGRGESVDVAWQLEGRVSRLRSLKINIQGKETAIYRRGTSKITDHHVFCEIPVAELTDVEDMQFGSATIEIASDTMHTFEANNSQVNWSVVLQGDVPFWADVKDTFDFRVKP